MAALPINIVKNRHIDEPLNAREINKARGLIGALNGLPAREPLFSMPRCPFWREA